MSIKIALAGNPNCGKTTLFNNLTGSNQYVGNWPGVTVEKKEGKLKGEKDVIIQDLPGIYSLSPYTLEEVVSRTYLVKEKPGQTDYTEAQKVYATATAPGVYTFDLGGRWVTGLRMDPDSVGGVPTLFTGIELNPARAWYTRFIPTAGWWLVLAFGPCIAAAFVSLFIRKK